MSYGVDRARFEQVAWSEAWRPECLDVGMSISPLNPLSSGFLQSIVGTALNAAGLSPSQSGSASSSTQQTDAGQLSPFSQLLSTLQQLQESNPSQYQQVTAQIATNLQTAAQTATSQGNTSAATELTQLSQDFSQASKTDQLPSVQDLAQAIGGHHHGHHHYHGSGGSNNNDNNSDSSDSITGNTTLSQLLSLFQSNAAQSNASNALDPLSIIDNTLTSAGITGSN